MIFDNTTVRRQDRLLDQESADQLLRTAEYGTLSMIDVDGMPYGIPINFVWDGDSAIYLHCAPEGRKLRALAQNNRVSFSIVGRVNLLPSQFTTEYESVVLTGEACVNLDDDERHRALRLLLQKLSPEDMEVGLRYAEKSLHRTCIVRLDIARYSAKCKRVGR